MDGEMVRVGGTCVVHLAADGIQDSRNVAHCRGSA